ncbi:class A beta-lactamase-related serine hydrolase [Dyadobacter chenwenxiniae]|uniref:beta-lactamase n=1 Tax=Dyadobacter chenwenxiniae TaxID=2906456 RepID=A0A9X1TI76_9BACT|nr:serine hydrolase [Dyadobacter chenwenxiniae]MCF0065560.1 class A beta-lactamase-related serine hydrolase [Dyadobacter chenwenxiniae]UON85471.1 class A beta-lactamase-related serine hydrolase [Dyadobacter chenwenxiniae]
MMLKKIMFGCLLVVTGCKTNDPTPDKDFVLKFIKENPGRSSIKLVRNDTLFALHNGDKMMPLASTAKIILAIEYARQAAAGEINAAEMVPVADLEKFNVSGTDGGAHVNWLSAVSTKIINQKISIREISKGMIQFSSNANQEWLLAKLGPEKVEAELKNLGVKNHDKVFYLASSLFVGKEAFPGLKGKSLAEKLRGMSNSEYLIFINLIHKKLLADPSYKSDIGDFGMDVQKVWSDRLTGSTVTEYAGILKKINDRKFFSMEEQKYLDEVMEYLLENPANSDVFEHIGIKGGSTLFVLTKAVYATDKKGNNVEFAYFFNDLSNEENSRLQVGMNYFDQNILLKPTFVQEVKEQIYN